MTNVTDSSTWRLKNMKSVSRNMLSPSDRREQAEDCVAVRVRDKHRCYGEAVQHRGAFNKGETVKKEGDHLLC